MYLLVCHIQSDLPIVLLQPPTHLAHVLVPLQVCHTQPDLPSMTCSLRPPTFAHVLCVLVPMLVKHILPDPPTFTCGLHPHPMHFQSACTAWFLHFYLQPSPHLMHAPVCVLMCHIQPDPSPFTCGLHHPTLRIYQSAYTASLIHFTCSLHPTLCMYHSGCSWWRHQMETFFTSLAICAGNSPVPGEFPAQRPVTWSFDVFFDLRLNKRLSKQSWGWWFETLSRPLWRHCNVMCHIQPDISIFACSLYPLLYPCTGPLAGVSQGGHMPPKL